MAQPAVSTGHPAVALKERRERAPCCRLDQETYALEMTLMDAAGRRRLYFVFRARKQPA
jgi:hypothetical protein